MINLSLVAMVGPALLGVEPIPAILGVFAAMGGIGALLGGYAASQARQDKVKADEAKYQVDLVQATTGAMEKHMVTLAADNKSTRDDLVITRKELADVHSQLQQCQQDKYQMRAELAAERAANAEWRRKWEAKYGTAD
jgi:hypothetical protein